MARHMPAKIYHGMTTTASVCINSHGGGLTQHSIVTSIDQESMADAPHLAEAQNVTEADIKGRDVGIV